MKKPVHHNPVLADVPKRSEMIARRKAQEAQREAERKEAERQAKAQQPLPESETNPVPVVLGTATATNQPITLSLTERVRGLYIIGLNGTGKSNLLLEMITQDIREGHGLCLLDPHGDLTNAILDRMPPEREDDLIILDMNVEKAAWGLNIFTCPNPHSTEDVTSTIDYVEQTFERLWDMENAAGLADLLHSVTVTFVYNPGTTITDIPRLLSDAQYRTSLVATVKDQMVKDFWTLQYDTLSASGRQTLYASLMRRLRKLMTPLLYNIVSQRTNSIDFRSVMDDGNILLVQLHPKMRNVTELLGTVIVGQLLIAALSREDIPIPENRRPFYLYADEYHRFATSAFGDLIQEARKFNIATVMAHQLRYQLRMLGEAVSKAPLGAPNLVLFQVEAEDARELAGRFTPKAPPPAIIGHKPKDVIVVDPLHAVRHSKRAQDPTLHALLQRIEQHITSLPYPETYDWFDASHAANVRRQQEENAWNEASAYIADVLHGRSTNIHTLQYFHDAAMKAVLLRLAVLLTNNPPTVQSFDQFEPEYSSPPSESELRQQLIKQLVTMPKYTAYCTTEHGEYRMRTLYHPVPVNLAKRARLREASRNRYYRPVQQETQQNERNAKQRRNILWHERHEDGSSPPAIINPPPSYDADHLPPTSADHEEGDDWFDTFGDPKTP